MIILKKIVCKNFMSFGNTPTEFNLHTHKSTLLQGVNGSGKSVIALDAVLYALYGKPYRDINKGQLINAINQGGLEVELDFEIGPIKYKIIRGMKPNIFDIFKDGILIEQEAAIRDYQWFLENHILKINERTFKQIAVLGSASFVPFMQMPPQQRRELIESILDIGIFSNMNSILKERILYNREQLTKITSELTVKKAEATAQQKLIKVIEKNSQSRVNEIIVEKENCELTIKQVLIDIEALQLRRDTLSIQSFDVKVHNNLSSDVNEASREINVLKETIKDIQHLDICPTCRQKVSVKHISKVKKTIENSITIAEKYLTELKQKLDISTQQMEKYTEYTDLIKSFNDKIEALDSVASNFKLTITQLEDKIKSVQSETTDVDLERQKLKLIGTEAVKLLDEKTKLSEEKHIQEVAQHLLKDTGIKTAIVKKYLPMMNKLINNYLAMFDFYVDFTLDENFNEVIRSRGRDIFSYSSFSEGEKRKLDFSILLSFRQLAAIKNSAKTNVLILDEILDHGLDLIAMQQASDIISNIPNSNTIVISHGDVNTNQYDRIIKVEKHNDFSTLDYVE